MSGDAVRGEYDVAAIRAEFPILGEIVHDKPLAYLDNAATTQKPQAVIDALVHYYTHDNANIHRGVHTLSQRATDKYEAARLAVVRFLNAADPAETIFVRGATEGINLVAQAFARPILRPGDEILITGMEHHSNIVPWQLLCEQTGAVLRVVPFNDAGELLLDEYDKLLGPKTRVVSMVHVSNALGTINPIVQMTEAAHRVGAVVLVDGAQAAPHMKVDVRAIGCDFYVMSAHKVYGPTGVGILYGRRGLLEAMPPYQVGGDMIASVTFDKTIYNSLPYKFEAGTPNIAGGIGLGAAIEFVNRIGIERIAAHETELLEYATHRLVEVPGLTLVGTASVKASVLSFVLANIHPHDIGTIVDEDGIAVRTGHHCAQPVMDRYGISATTRASFGCYNTKDEIDRLVLSLSRVSEVFS